MQKEDRKKKGMPIDWRPSKWWISCMLENKDLKVTE